MFAPEPEAWTWNWPALSGEISASNRTPFTVPWNAHPPGFFWNEPAGIVVEKVPIRRLTGCVGGLITLLLVPWGSVRVELRSNVVVEKLSLALSVIRLKLWPGLSGAALTVTGVVPAVWLTFNPVRVPLLVVSVTDAVSNQRSAAPAARCSALASILCRPRPPQPLGLRKAGRA